MDQVVCGDDSAKRGPKQVHRSFVFATDVVNGLFHVAPGGHRVELVRSDGNAALGPPLHEHALEVPVHVLDHISHVNCLRTAAEARYAHHYRPFVLLLTGGQALVPVDGLLPAVLECKNFPVVANLVPLHFAEPGFVTQEHQKLDVRV